MPCGEEIIEIQIECLGRRWWIGEEGGGSSQLLLWEALVTGAEKQADHAGDAHVAVEAFRCRRGRRADQAEQDGAFNLLVAAALWAGLDVPHDELSTPAVVYSPRVG